MREELKWRKRLTWREKEGGDETEERMGKEGDWSGRRRRGEEEGEIKVEGGRDRSRGKWTKRKNERGN